MSNFEFCCWLW